MDTACLHSEGTLSEVHICNECRRSTVRVRDNDGPIYSSLYGPCRDVRLLTEDDVPTIVAAVIEALASLP